MTDPLLYGWYVEVFERVGEDDSDTVKTLGPYATKRLAEKAEDGVNINLNHERFWTGILHAKPF